MEFELLTLGIKSDGTVKIHFNPQLLTVVTEKELINEISDDMQLILPIAEKIINLIKSKTD